MAENTTKITRRHFVRNSVLLTGGVALMPALLTSCKDDSDDPAINYTGNYGFREGVASFDPSASNIILWTRYTNADNESGDASVRWEIATSNAFSPLVASGTVTASATTDYTAVIDVPGLSANTKYYYRFRNERTKAESVVGETRTLPTGSQASSVKLAVVSCANFPSGLFNVYGAAAASDADVVVHLGDYIYEYGAGSYGTTSSTAALNRAHLPVTEILNLGDYRTRYRQYRSDKQLQRAHQLKPFICIWDDHEYADDAYSTGAENHQPATEGSFEDRRRAANQRGLSTCRPAPPTKTKSTVASSSATSSTCSCSTPALWAATSNWFCLITSAVLACSMPLPSARPGKTRAAQCWGPTSALGSAVP
jgi:alkaline phosphatase D